MNRTSYICSDGFGFGALGNLPGHVEQQQQKKPQMNPTLCNDITVDVHIMINSQMSYTVTIDILPWRPKLTNAGHLKENKKTTKSKLN